MVGQIDLFKHEKQLHFLHEVTIDFSFLNGSFWMPRSIAQKNISKTRERRYRSRFWWKLIENMIRFSSILPQPEVEMQIRYGKGFLSTIFGCSFKSGCQSMFSDKALATLSNNTFSSWSARSRGRKSGKNCNTGCQSKFFHIDWTSRRSPIWEVAHVTRDFPTQFFNISLSQPT